jgi:hypothetical protein
VGTGVEGDSAGGVECLQPVMVRMRHKVVAALKMRCEGSGMNKREGFITT